VFSEGRLALDETQTMPGRGGYVHRDRNCVSKMNQRGRWERALRLEAGVLPSDSVGGVVQRILLELFLEDEQEVDSGVKESAGRLEGRKGPVLKVNSKR
jgi:predicted RNA-binding protein YlxR (DUF448 family)